MALSKSQRWYLCDPQNEVDEDSIVSLIEQCKGARIKVTVHLSIGDIEKVTHLVMHTQKNKLVPRTQAYMKALLCKKWIASTTLGLSDSIQQGEFQSEVEHEVAGDTISGISLAPTRARTSAKPKLLQGLTICFYGAFNLRASKQAHA
ncbi:predicted protein [Lichtheimia corymbifera JMRC:FSU:9682]|uniref:Uncharacterized protein n=1 Tax=Lichtheimia corymbifera JMRC:FSU:9682 TaxID=1263082 RepID=A0A068S4Q5_9FUNG|nr:predicted protein [Lichtheimia corymbifera JMRC:FSU:9682]